jgi:hypothetical protein
MGFEEGRERRGIPYECALSTATIACKVPEQIVENKPPVPKILVV